LDGRLVIPVIQEMQRSLSVILGIEGNINAGSRQRQAKEFALAGVASIKRMEGASPLYKGDISRDCAGIEDEYMND
jgi:hypothetical protein